MSGWAERIHAALLETDDAFSALHAARAAGEPTATLDRLSQEAANRSNKMIAACRDAFARARNWTYNRKAGVVIEHNDKTARDCDRIIDRGEYFDSLSERRVALVVHSHATKEELADWAARHSWNCELIPFSWWSPKYRRAVVFTRRIGASWPR